MGNPAVVTLQLPTAVGNGIAQAQAVAAAGALTLNGSLATAGVATLSPARRVVVASTGADGTVVFTINGTNRYSNAISEALTGVTSTNSVNTNQDFLTVTSVLSSAATAGNISVGTNGVGSSEWQAINIQITPVSIAIGVTLVSGAANYTVEHTYDDPNASQAGTIEPLSFQPPRAWPDSILSGKSATGETYINLPFFAYRITVNSGTGTVVMQGIQAGNANF